MIHEQDKEARTITIQMEGLTAEAFSQLHDHSVHQRAVIKALREALVDAKRTIHALHGPRDWDIYEQHAPEMKRLNAALAQTKELDGG